MARPFDVWYQRNPLPAFMGVLREKMPTVVVECIKETHVRVCRARVGGLERLWTWMQAETWSPNGEARPLIEMLGLQHTSMSVGDVAFDAEDHSWWMVDAFGWKEVRADGEADGDD